MKSRYALTLLVLAVLTFVTANYFQSTKAENNQLNEIQSLIAQPNPTTDLTEIKTLTKTQKAIPDEIAYEVFLRTVGENNARQLLVQAGFDESRDSDKIEQMMYDAKSVGNLLKNLDKQAKETKLGKDGGRNFLADAKIKSILVRLQSDKKNILQQVISRNLQDSARFDNGWKKLNNYVQTTVKSQMQVVDAKSSSRLKRRKKGVNDVAFIKTSAERFAAQTQVGDAYLYSTAWSEGENVFGSGMITEQSASGTSYLVSVTVTSPSGRTNTTSGDWNYATLSNNTGLSLGIENGTYNVQANFEADQGGYYDEWGNYYSYVTYFVGSLTDSVFVLPIISLSSVSPNIIFNRISSTAQNGTVNISLSFDIGNLPQPVYITVDLTKQSGDDFYTVRPAEGTNPPNGRLLERLPHSNRGNFIPAAFAFTPNQNFLPAGQALEQFRISRVEKRMGTHPQTNEPIYVELSSTTDFQYGTRSRDINLSIPAQSNAGGGCGSCSYAGLGCIGCANGGYCQPPFFNQFGCCCQGSPIVIDVAGNGYAMTNGANGVSFDLGGDGIKEQPSWTTANSDDAWLALDRNDNQTIDDGKELFGNYCDQPAPPPGELRNGFSGLAEFDKAANGGNGDGKITRADAVFRKLRLWQDKNHNGISEPEELSRLPALDVVALFLDYKESKRTDEHGNSFKFRAKVRDAKGIKTGRWAWDVFVVPPQ